MNVLSYLFIAFLIGFVILQSVRLIQSIRDTIKRKKEKSSAVNSDTSDTDKSNKGGIA